MPFSDKDVYRTLRQSIGDGDRLSAVVVVAYVDDLTSWGWLAELAINCIARDGTYMWGGTGTIPVAMIIMRLAGRESVS